MKKLKRSEIEGMLLDLVGQQERIGNVLEKLDAGVVWAPEEEPLPEKIFMDFRADGISHLAVIWEGSSAFIAQLETPHYDRCPIVARKRIVREMVRRNNAWPELEEMRRYVNKNPSAASPSVRNQINEILNGK